MLILTVPLIDQSLQMNLYKVYNLSILHPKLKVHAQYEIEGTYLTMLMEGVYVCLPSAIDITLCLMTTGHLCMFDQALYPVERINWCIYTNLAYSLDGYLWPISALAAEKLQIRCVMETHIIDITPPLKIVDVGNGCEAFSASIYIPAKSELTATLQSVTRSQYFLDYNVKYTNINNFLAWYDFKFAELTEADVKTLKAKMLQLPPMPMEMFEEIVENIDEDYPFSFSPKIILAMLVVMGIFMITSVVLFIWCKRKTTPSFSTL